MLQITTFSDLEVGDILLILLGDNETAIITVEEIMEDELLIIPKEFGGMDYTPPNLDQIIRLGSKGVEPSVFVLSQSIHLRLSKEWQEIIESK